MGNSVRRRRRRVGGIILGAGVAAPDFDSRLAGGTFQLQLSPGYLSDTWVEAGNPSVQVEKGWGSGTFQDLYPHTDNKLYAQSFGRGQVASTFAGGERLLVERIYNQGGSDPASDFVTALSDDRRVLLNVDTEDAPFFAGYSTGTQDPNQHATERGYGIPQSLQTNDHLLQAIMVYEAAAGETVRLIQDTAASPSRYWQFDGNANKRHFANWDIVVNNFERPGVPNVLSLWGADDARGLATEYNLRPGSNGIVTATNIFGTEATSYALNVMGPTNSIQGKCYALLIAIGAVSIGTMQFTGLPSSLSGLFAPAIQTDLPVLAFPYGNAVVPMNLDTETADIPVRLLGKPATEYEAQWQAGGYASIGTTDANGALDGALSGQSKGNGTLDIREVGGSTPISISDVAVGIVVYAMGESGADGRGTNVTHTIPTGSLRKERLDWTADSNEWWKLFLQNLYDEFTAVIGVTKVAAGSTVFLNGATKGQWNVDPAAAPALSSKGKSQALGMQAGFLTPNFWLWDLGKNDAATLTSEADFEAEFTALLTDYKTELDNALLTFHPVMIGENGTVADANTDAIRRAIKDLWGTAGFTPAGSFAHILADLDGTHFDTQAQKQKAADVVTRYLRGSGRAPQYSSGSVSGSDVTLTLTGGVSPMTHTAPDVAGWTVSDDNGARTVSSVGVSGLDVTLTCDQALAGTVSVQWASGDSAVGTSLLDSDATTPLPLEPFGPVNIAVP